MALTNDEKTEVARLARKGLDAVQIFHRMLVSQPHAVLYEEVVDEMNRIASLEERAITTVGEEAMNFLRWSWNFGIAEDMAEQSLKENARQISGGITRGEDMHDVCELLQDFVERRTWNKNMGRSKQQLTYIRDEWVSDNQLVNEYIKELLRAQGKQVAA